MEKLFANIPWAEYGISAIVIVGLLLLLYKITNELLKRFDRVVETHLEERREWRQMMQDRGTAWLTSAEKRDEKLERALDNLARSLNHVK